MFSTSGTTRPRRGPHHPVTRVRPSAAVGPESHFLPPFPNIWVYAGSMNACDYCGGPITRVGLQGWQGNEYCSLTCRASYNNEHSRTSFLEQIEQVKEREEQELEEGIAYVMRSLGVTA